MSSSDSTEAGDKKYEPSHTKIENSWKKGNFPFAKEFLDSLIIVIYSAFFYLMMNYMYELVSSHFSVHCIISEDYNFSLKQGAILWGLCIIPICMIVFIAGMIQTRGLVHMRNFDFVFFTKNPWKESLTSVFLLKLLIKIMSFVFLLYTILDLGILEAKKWFYLKFFYQKNHIISWITNMWVRIVLLLVIFGLFSYGIKYYQWFSSLFSTLEEVKKELKDTEIAQNIKQQLHQRATEILQNKKSIQGLDQATMLIVNPTHYAIGIRWSFKASVPVVVTKCKGAIVRTIKEIAQQKNIPIVQRTGFARLLYKKVKLNKPIPSKYHAALLEVVQYLLSINTHIFDQ